MPPGRQQRLGRPHGQLVHARPARAPASAKAGRTAHAARPSVLEPPDAPPGQSSSRFVMQLERGAATVTSDALHGTLGVCEGLLNLARRGLYLHKGTVVDATISKAPSAMTGSFRMRLCSPRVCRCRAALGRATTPHRFSSREALCLFAGGVGVGLLPRAVNSRLLREEDPRGSQFAGRRHRLRGRVVADSPRMSGESGNFSHLLGVRTSPPRR